jgi:D-beta-D-heptose 7-phosphate kinase/D-beta-D-heptose 1-phosphate adenosyltransferase
MLDRYLFGSTGRISPEAPVPVVHVHETDNRPGGAANVAVNLASLGVSTNVVGVVGNDAAADSLEAIMSEHGIACNFARAGDRPTITKTRVQSRGQQLIRLDEENVADMPGDAMVSTLRSVLEGAGAVVLSDYGKGALADVSVMIALCREAGVRRSSAHHDGRSGSRCTPGYPQRKRHVARRGGRQATVSVDPGA